MHPVFNETDVDVDYNQYQKITLNSVEGTDLPRIYFAIYSMSLNRGIYFILDLHI